ncbi:hypothetical protein AAG570_013216 [Ranatra chinensis]|uniref:Uncharacterized protein n=1 Tax=Ranatra chinensis TaxID=642074 RepID=A0ABD0YG64_9HEMI
MVGLWAGPQVIRSDHIANGPLFRLADVIYLRVGQHLCERKMQTFPEDASNMGSGTLEPPIVTARSTPEDSELLNAFGRGQSLCVLIGSMYFDEEGSVAHEFYEEIRPDEPGAKPYMKRQLNNLTPQGEVSYNYPRLSGDCDIIICDP